jgi:hypothetical protein
MLIVTNMPFMFSAIMLSLIYAEVTNTFFMFSVIMLTVVMASVVMPYKMLGFKFLCDMPPNIHITKKAQYRVDVLIVNFPRFLITSCFLGVDKWINRFYAFWSKTS